jgi:hypothetical protein
MKSSIDHVRALAAKNAALMAQAKSTHAGLLDAADAEDARLGQAIAATDRAAVLADPGLAAVYRKQVRDRASIQRLAAERHA